MNSLAKKIGIAALIYTSINTADICRHVYNISHLDKTRDQKIEGRIGRYIRYVEDEYAKYNSSLAAKVLLPASYLSLRHLHYRWKDCVKNFMRKLGTMHKMKEENMKKE